MRRLWIGLTVLFVLAGAAPGADALTLEITSGVAGGNNSATLSGGYEGGLTVSGDRFTLRGDTAGTFTGFGERMRVVARLTLDGVTYANCLVNCVDDSDFFFVSTFAEPTPFGLSTYHGPYTTTFTMTGHTPLAGGVDFVGSGTMTTGWVFTNEAHTAGFQFIHWTFLAPDVASAEATVPEPGVLLLLALGLAVVHRIVTPPPMVTPPPIVVGVATAPATSACGYW